MWVAANGVVLAARDGGGACPKIVAKRGGAGRGGLASRAAACGRVLPITAEDRERAGLSTSCDHAVLERRVIDEGETVVLVSET